MWPQTNAQNGVMGPRAVSQERLSQEVVSSLLLLAGREHLACLQYVHLQVYSSEHALAFSQASFKAEVPMREWSDS